MSTEGYELYQMTEERQRRLWEDCIFVFDASALLALYLYPEEARQRIYSEIFEKVKGRLWIPHHVLFEYLKNRATKIREPISRSYKPLEEEYIQPMIASFSKSLNKIDALKNNLRHAERHPYIVSEAIESYHRQLNDFLKTTLAFGQAFNTEMEQKIAEILQLEQRDTVFEHVKKCFAIGREYSYSEILEITREGKHRYEFKIPPGYEDLKDKIGTQIFGDLIIWKQLLEYAKENKRNVVFVCNDLKEDWWHLLEDKKTKRTNGPRKELIKEFNDHAGMAFWMYNPARFLEVANTLIRSNVPNRYIEHISGLVAAGTLNKWLIYTCNACGKTGTVDTAQLALQFETTGVAPHYVANSGFPCSHCGHPIQAVFEVSEQPSGIIGAQQLTLKGASLSEFDLSDDHFQEEPDSNGVAPEESLVIDKKTLRLKCNALRTIRFKTPVNGNETLFVAELKHPQATQRLLVEGYNKQKHRITKTLVMQPGQTRFVLHSDEERFSEELVYLQLTATENMTLVLSATEYPGTGRYLQKLIY